MAFIVCFSQIQKNLKRMRRGGRSFPLSFILYPLQVLNLLTYFFCFYQEKTDLFILSLHDQSSGSVLNLLIKLDKFLGYWRLQFSNLNNEHSQAEGQQLSFQLNVFLSSFTDLVKSTDGSGARPHVLIVIVIFSFLNEMKTQTFLKLGSSCLPV